MSYSSNSIAQIPRTLWSNAYGGGGADIANDIQQTIDGGYIIVGQTNSFGAGDFDVWLVRTDKDGNSLWTQSFGGEAMDVGHSVQQMPDGGFIVAGETRSFGAGIGDVWLIRTDPEGRSLWTKTFGGSDLDSGSAVRLTADGGFVITGYTFSFGAGGGDAWLIVTDSTGAEQLNKTFGNEEYQVAHDVLQTEDGGYILVGSTEPDGTDADVWVVRTDASGFTDWTLTYGDTITESDIDHGKAIEQTPDGGYIVAGDTFSEEPGTNVRLLRFDGSGTVLWSYTYLNTNLGYDVAVSADGGFLVAATSAFSPTTIRDAQLLRTDSFGTLLGLQSYAEPDDDRGHAITATSDGGYALAGMTKSFGAGESDFWLTRLEGDNDTSTGNASHPDQFPSLSLLPNYPNPFNTSTSIPFQLATTHHVSIEIYTIMGKKVRSLVNKSFGPGTHNAQWDGRDQVGLLLPTGIYFYRVVAGEYVLSRMTQIIR